MCHIVIYNIEFNALKHWSLEAVTSVLDTSCKVGFITSWTLLKGGSYGTLLFVSQTDFGNGSETLVSVFQASAFKFGTVEALNKLINISPGFCDTKFYFWQLFDKFLCLVKTLLSFSLDPRSSILMHGCLRKFWNR